MFRTCLIVVFLLSFQLLIFGQEAVKKIHFGLSVAPIINISNFKSSPDVNNPFSWGMVMGGDVYFDLSPILQFKTGLNFHNVTLKHRDFSPLYPDDFVNGQVDVYKSFWDFNTAYTFVGFPLQIKIKTTNKPNHIFLGGGVEVEQKLYSSGNIEGIESGISGNSYKPDDFLFKIRATQIFIVANAGFEWGARKSKLMLGPLIEYSTSQNFEIDAAALRNGHLFLFGIRFAYN